MTTDTSEKGLESLIVEQMTGAASAPVGAGFDEEPQPFVGLHNWLLGNPADYDRAWTVDLNQLRAFLSATQPHLAPPFDLDSDSPVRQKFLARLQGEITKRGVIDVLRHGIKHGPHHVDLFYGTPSPGNAKAAERFAHNRFTVTRQLRYSRDETQNALDLGAVHQRPADRHLRAEEQPDQADRRGRRRAIQARPRSARAAVPVRPLHGAFRRRRRGSALLHASERQELVVPAVQPGMERRRGQPAESRTASRPTTSGSASSRPQG